MTPGRRALLLALVAVAIGAGVVLLRGARSTTVTAGDTPVAAASPDDRGTSLDRRRHADPPAVELAMASIAVPPRHTPVDVVVSELLPYAEAGHPQAQCRLAAEMLACREIAHHYVDERLYPGSGRRESTAPPGDETEARQRDRVARIRELHARCEALPASVRNRGDEWLIAAARGGNVEATLRYIEGDHLWTRGSHDFLAHPDFDAWRRDAPVMLESLLRQGVPEAVHLALFGAASDVGLGAALLPDDLDRQYLMTALLGRLRGFGEDTAPGILDAATRAPINAEAARRHAQWFDNRVYTDDEVRRRLYWPSPLDDLPTARAPCSD